MGFVAGDLGALKQIKVASHEAFYATGMVYAKEMPKSTGKIFF